MVGLGKKASLLAIVLAMTLFAGCVGDDEVGADSEGTDAKNTDNGAKGSDSSGDDETKDDGKETVVDKDAAKAGCQFQFCIEGHVYAPAWDAGMTWTYQVTGSFYTTTDYEVTFGVFKVNEDHFLVGTDSETELINSVTSHYGVMTGAVQKDSYAVLEHEDYQDILGFRKIEDTTWKARLWDNEFTLVKEPTTEIEHAKGTSLGIRVNGGTQGGDTLVLEYAADAAWLTKLEWTGPDGNVLLSYVLTDYNHAGSTSGFRIWDRALWTTVSAIGNNGPVGLAVWNAKEHAGASFALLHVRTDEGVTAIARVTKPNGEAEEFQHSGGEIENRKTDYQDEGNWIFNIVTDRGTGSGAQITIQLFVVVERS